MDSTCCDAVNYMFRRVYTLWDPRVLNLVVVVILGYVPRHAQSNHQLPHLVECVRTRVCTQVSREYPGTKLDCCHTRVCTRIRQNTRVPNLVVVVIPGYAPGCAQSILYPSIHFLELFSRAFLESAAAGGYVPCSFAIVCNV